MNLVESAAERDLQSFQDGFAAALLAPADAGSPVPQIAELVRQPGFAVYRNTVMRGCIDALQANYPAVARLVGEEWFRAAAGIYARERLPVQPSLLAYGDRFAEFLAEFGPARELPYLVGVARLDRFWTEAHVAPDEMAVTAAAIARLSDSQLSSAVLLPHASTRWAWFEEQPIYTIWSRNREQADSDSASEALEIDWQAEGALLARPAGHVTWAPLSASGCAFLDRCADGMTLADAADAALRVDAKTNLSHLMEQLLSAGAFSRLALYPL